MAESILTDLRRAFRQIRRAPGYAIAVVATLALTVGVTATLFSLYNALVIRTLPVADPSRVVLVQPTDEKGQNRPLYASMYRELERLPVFEHLALFSGGGIFPVEARNVRAEGLIEAVTPGFHEALGLQPFLGRYFTDADLTGVDAPTVVLSHALWRKVFNGDPAAIGDRVLIGGEPMTVIGVTPPAFKGFYVDTGFGFSVPMSVLNRYLGSDPKRPVRGLQAVGRIRPGVSVSQAHAAVDAAWQSIRAEAIPAQLPVNEQREIATHRIKVESLASGFSGLRTRYRQPLRILLAITVVLLFIGCVNLSGLMLARTAARDHQFAILSALGASRGRFVQQVMVESVVLSALGTALSLPLAWLGSRILTAAIWRSQERLAVDTAPDLRVLLAAGFVSVLAGLLVAVLPAIRAARRRQLALRAERSTTHAVGRLGRALLVVQIALSLVLLAGAGLFTASLWNLRHIDTGFDSANVRWTRLFAVPGGYRNENDDVYYSELLRQIEGLPEIRSVAMASLFPTYFNVSHFLTRHAVAPLAPAGTPATEAWMEGVTPGFFHTTGIRLLQGRDVSWADSATGPGVAILNETLSRLLFPQGNAIGQRIRVGTEPRRSALEVIGVVDDASIGDLRAPHMPVVFRPKMQELMRAPVLLYQAASDAAAADAAVASVVASLGHEYPRGFYSIDGFANEALIQERLLAGLSGLFAALALLLAVVGLHGSLAYGVAQRTREIGVRMALGASRRRVIRMIVHEGVLVAVLGAVVGIPAALAASRVARSLLFGLDPSNPWMAVAAGAVFIVVGAAAGLWPAMRAASVDPSSALRAD